MPPIGPISDEMFDRYVQWWQSRQRPVRPTYQSGQTGFPQSVRPVVPTGPSGQLVSSQHEVSSSTQPNSLSSFDKMLAEYKNDLANLIKVNFGVDVKSKTHVYLKSYPASFDSVAYHAGFRLAEFIKFRGGDTRSTFEHISQYLAQLGEAGSINELKVHFFSLSLTGITFLWFFLLWYLILLAHGNN